MTVSWVTTHNSDKAAATPLREDPYHIQPAPPGLSVNDLMLTSKEACELMQLCAFFIDLVNALLIPFFLANLQRVKLDSCRDRQRSALRGEGILLIS